MVCDRGSFEQTVCNGAIVRKALFPEITADDRCVRLDNDMVHIDAVEVVAIVVVFAVAESGKSIIKIVLAAFQHQRVAFFVIHPAVALINTIRIRIYFRNIGLSGVVVHYKVGQRPITRISGEIDTPPRICEGRYRQKGKHHAEGKKQGENAFFHRGLTFRFVAA